MFDIAKKKAFVCDLDGTLFMGANPIKSAVDFVIESTNSGRFRFFYLTNNTSKCPEEYMKKIAGAAIPVVPEQILTPLITLFPFLLMGAIGSLAALDFLGFGLPPMTPSCGDLLKQATANPSAWWLILFPSLALFVVMLLTVLVGEGLRDAFDPRQKSKLE